MEHEDQIQANNDPETVVSSYQDYVIELTDIARTLNADQHLAGALRANMSVDQFRKAYGVQDTDDKERVVHAQAKPEADFGAFNLLDVFVSMENRGNPEYRRLAEPSFRCIEQIRNATPEHNKYNPTNGGVMVPWELLVAEQLRNDTDYRAQYNRARGRIQAATTTSTSVAGITQEELRPETFVETLLEMNMFNGLLPDNHRS